VDRYKGRQYLRRRIGLTLALAAIAIAVFGPAALAATKPVTIRFQHPLNGPAAVTTRSFYLLGKWTMSYAVFCPHVARPSFTIAVLEPNGRRAFHPDIFYKGGKAASVQPIGGGTKYPHGGTFHLVIHSSHCQWWINILGSVPKPTPLPPTATPTATPVPTNLAISLHACNATCEGLGVSVSYTNGVAALTDPRSGAAVQASRFDLSKTPDGLYHVDVYESEHMTTPTDSEYTDLQSTAGHFGLDGNGMAVDFSGDFCPTGLSPLLADKDLSPGDSNGGWMCSRGIDSGLLSARYTLVYGNDSNLFGQSIGMVDLKAVP
jgi:hypothetical protein